MKTLKTFLKESSSEQDFVNKQYALVKAKIRKKFPRDDQGLYTIKVINELKMIAFGLTTRFGMVSSGGTKFKPSVTALFDILIKDLEKNYKNKQYIKESVLKESKGEVVADKFRQQYNRTKINNKAGESAIDVDIDLARDTTLNLVVNKDSGDIAFTGLSNGQNNKAFPKRYVISDRYKAIDFINRIIMLAMDENGIAPKAQEWFMFFASQLKRDSHFKAI